MYKIIKKVMNYILIQLIKSHELYNFDTITIIITFFWI